MKCSEAFVPHAHKVASHSHTPTIQSDEALIQISKSQFIYFFIFPSASFALIETNFELLVVVVDYNYNL
jgi:hypothetical protein